ncbi:MAG TPA: HAMP domain-containing methyl-accepting chemotaxis protein [Kofleriaceae bacterium]|nr:HAMP domain-containing methyl-accepting chemotaxis protein [Kofleriaceae bacterium]
MTRIRFPMFLKFWVGCFSLAALLIAGGVLVVQKETRSRGRSYYLKKHFQRYVAYQEAMGRALSSVTDVLAADGDLRRALAGAQAAGEAGAASAAVPSTGAAAIAQTLHDQVSSKSGVRPDLFLLFDERGLVWRSPSTPIEADDLRQLEPVARARQGGAILGSTMVAGGHAYQISAVPVLAPGGERVVGGVLLGVALERTMREYRELSDDVPALQHRPVLVHEGAVVASVFPREEWEDLAEQLQEDAWVQVADASDKKRPIIQLDEGPFDFHREEVEGFAGATSGPIGQMFLLRPRSDAGQEGATIPWNAIITGAILSFIIASLLALWITRPIKRFVNQSQRMLEGGADLNQRLETRSSDETADLAANINQVFARLYQLASEVQGAAFQVGASSAEISAASKHMLDGLRDQTLKIESSTAAVTELSASIQQVASNAVEATKVAEKSNVAVLAAVDRMQQIRGSVEEAAEKMSELGESSKRIGNIVEVIRQISEQTSLLALNASIEAAHAGEQGRGFAVVADEVSSLARRVGQSAKDIEALIQTIKEQTAEAVQSMQVGTREVEGGTELVTNTLHDLRQLISVVKDTAAAVQEQAMVSDEIARNMDAVQKIAAEMVAGSEEAVLQGEQLHHLAFNLEQSVGGFNIDGAGVGAAAREPGDRPPPAAPRAALKPADKVRRAG